MKSPLSSTDEPTVTTSPAATGPTTVADAPTVRELRARRPEAVRRMEDAVRERNAHRPNGAGSVLSLTVLRLEDAVEQATARLDELDRNIHEAERIDRERILAARQPGEMALLREMVTVAESLLTVASRHRAYRAETAAACGLAVGSDSLPGLNAIAEQLRRLQAALDPPAAHTPDPPATGKVRVRVLVRFRDPYGIWHWPVAGAGTEDFDADLAHDLVRRGWAARA